MNQVKNIKIYFTDQQSDINSKLELNNFVSFCNYNWNKIKNHEDLKSCLNYNTIFLNQKPDYHSMDLVHKGCYTKSSSKSNRYL